MFDTFGLKKNFLTCNLDVTSVYLFEMLQLKSIEAQIQCFGYGESGEKIENEF